MKIGIIRDPRSGRDASRPGRTGAPWLALGLLTLGLILAPGARVAAPPDVWAATIVVALVAALVPVGAVTALVCALAAVSRRTCA